MPPEQWWIFTFGYGQEHAGHYVRIYGTFSKARHKMIEKYGKEWAMQYSEQEWNKWVEYADAIGEGRYIETEMPF